MQIVQCCKCLCGIKLTDDIEVEYCCDGMECGCMGLPVGLWLCDECLESEINEGNILVPTLKQEAEK